MERRDFVAASIGASVGSLLTPAEGPAVHDLDGKLR